MRRIYWYMTVLPYNRAAAVAYAETWAHSRNPAYYDFERIGGDCTNYVSQCLFAGGGVMNRTPAFGWYYRSVNDRAPAWTGVEYLWRFLTANRGPGPFGREIAPAAVQPGDIVQLGRADGTFYHTPIVTAVTAGQILVAAHTFDAFDRPLSSYSFDRIRAFHIEGFGKL